MTIREGKKHDDWVMQNEIKRLPYKRALELEAAGKVKITNWADYIEKPSPRNMMNM
jgi:hypothetical protein